MYIQWRILTYTKYESRAWQIYRPKETQKKHPVYVIQTTMRMWFSPSPPLCLYTCTPFPPSKHLTCFTISLYGNSFLHSWWARALSLATVSGGLVVRIQHCICHGLTSISHQEPKPCFKLLQAKVTGDQRDGAKIDNYKFFKLNCVSKWRSELETRRILFNV